MYWSTPLAEFAELTIMRNDAPHLMRSEGDEAGEGEDSVVANVPCLRGFNCTVVAYEPSGSFRWQAKSCDASKHTVGLELWEEFRRAAFMKGGGGGSCGDFCKNDQEGDENEDDEVGLDPSAS